MFVGYQYDIISISQVKEKIIIENRNQQTMKKFILLMMLMTALSEGSDKPPALPGNTTSWLNNDSISWNQLRGKVVMLNVWTFG
jgi:hypothetical protein